MSNYPPPGGYQSGGYQGGSYGPPGGAPGGKTKVLNLDYNVAGLLCYVPCCVHLVASLLFIVTEPKENRFVRFHALQSLLLTGILIVVYIIFWVLQAAIGVSDTGVAGGFVALLLLLVQLAVVAIFLVLFIMGMIKAYQGQMWKAPMIGDIAEKNS